MQTGHGFIFINLEQAAGFGHVGWGFQLSDDLYYFGSTDHLWNTDYPIWHPLELIRYMSVAPGENTDHWTEMGSKQDMIEMMRGGPHIRYHSYKSIAVDNPNIFQAKVAANEMKDRGWNIWLDNCVHKSHAIATIYGATLPGPSKLSNRQPKEWFRQIQSEEVVIEKPSGRIILPSQARSDNTRRA